MMNDVTYQSFIDPPEETALEVVDRSKLENYATCPGMAVSIDRGLCNNNSTISNIGQCVHDAFSQATNFYIDNGGHVDVADIANEMESALRSSRPDVQPQVVEAAKYSCYGWGRYLKGKHPENILRFDGGENERSGQLAWDIEALGLRFTAELDFLATTQSPEVLEDMDYKSGWKRYYIDTIANRFQFRMHAWLVLNNYPEIQALSVRVWQPRFGGAGYPVLFKRSQMNEFEPQIRHAAGLYKMHRNDLPQLAPTWPAEDKCAICSAAAICPAAGLPASEIATDPSAYVERMHAIDASLTAMRKAAASRVKATGMDIVTPSGLAFGLQKPSSGRKLNSLYSVKDNQSEEDDSE